MPRKSIWVGGLRSVGKTAEEAEKLYRDFKSLEDAGAFAVESEVIPGPVMAEISPRTKMITVSLGSGTGGDVMFLFMNDLCGETSNPPRLARAFGNLGVLHEALYNARVQPLNDFENAALGGEFPTPSETPDLDAEELDAFRKALSKY